MKRRSSGRLREEGVDLARDNAEMVAGRRGAQHSATDIDAADLGTTRARVRAEQRVIAGAKETVVAGSHARGEVTSDEVAPHKNSADESVNASDDLGSLNIA